MSITVVANPTSGSGRAARVLPGVVGRLREMFGDRRIVVRRTLDYAQAREVCAEAVARRAEHDVLVMVGGDGMVHLGLDAAAGTDLALALVPAGSGNDLCRGLGLDVRRPLRAVELMAGHPRPLDLIGVSDAHGGTRWVGSIVCSGFDALVNARANARRFPPGALQYPAALFAELATFRPVRYRIAIDGLTQQLPAMLIAIGNTAYYGGGVRICPEADPTDGLLDLTVIRPVSRRLLLRMFPQIYSGTFTSLDQVDLLRATTIELDGSYADGRPLEVMGDGESLGTAPFTLRLVPQAVRVFRPDPPAPGR